MTSDYLEKLSESWNLLVWQIEYNNRNIEYFGWDYEFPIYFWCNELDLIILEKIETDQNIWGSATTFS